MIREFGHAKRNVAAEKCNSIWLYTVSTAHHVACWCWNKISYEQFRYIISIAGPISFVDTPIVQSVKENETAVISCQVDGEPQPIISWLYNGVLIDGELIAWHWMKCASFERKLFHSCVADDSPEYVKTSEGLAIKRVTSGDSGEYTCRAYQISTTINNVKEQTIRLNIQRKFISRMRRSVEWRLSNILFDWFCFFSQINLGDCWRATIIITDS